jgi:Arc/MetJ family transcription regulator
VAKHLVEIDPEALREAKAELRTSTIKETVNEALRRVGSGRGRRLRHSLDVLARARLLDRSQAWR